MGNNKKDEKEIPTITSLLKRRKLRPGLNMDESKPMDLSALEREFAPQEKSFEGLDWDTRGIARQDKHNEAAKKSDEFKAIIEKDAEQARDAEEITDRSAKRRERSISLSVKIKKPPQGTVIVKEPEPSALRPAKESVKPAVERAAPRGAAKSVAPRAPEAPTPPASRPTTRASAPAPQRGVSHARPLSTWTMEMLKNGPDPLGKGLSILLDRGAATALFLAISPPPPGAKIPHFVAAAAARPSREKLALWSGLRWDPATVPQVWNQLLKSGYVEFHPPGNVTNIGSKRNTIRAAFGMGNEQVLLLIRVGPVAACRGVLAVFSDRSLLLELGPILTLFNTPLPLQKAG